MGISARTFRAFKKLLDESSLTTLIGVVFCSDISLLQEQINIKTKGDILLKKLIINTTLIRTFIYIS